MNARAERSRVEGRSPEEPVTTWQPVSVVVERIATPALANGLPDVRHSVAANVRGEAHSAADERAPVAADMTTELRAGPSLSEPLYPRG